MLVVQIVSSIFKIAATIFGDRILAKWIGAIYFWMDVRAGKEIISESHRVYNQLINDHDANTSHDPTRRP